MNPQPTLCWLTTEDYELSDDNDVSQVTKYVLASGQKFIHATEETTQEGLRRDVRHYATDYEKVVWARWNKPQITQAEFFAYIAHLKQSFREQIEHPMTQFSYERARIGDPKSPLYHLLYYKLVSPALLLILQEKEEDLRDLNVHTYQLNDQEDFDFQLARQFDTKLSREDYQAHYDRIWANYETAD